MIRKLIAGLATGVMLLLGVVALAPASSAAPAPAPEVAQQAAAIPYAQTLAVMYQDYSYNQPCLRGAFGCDSYNLKWTLGSCNNATLPGYTWTREWLPGEALFDDSKFTNAASNWVTSVKIELRSKCNYMYLISNDGAGWGGCVRPGTGNPGFGPPWNDNIRQITIVRRDWCAG